MFWIFYWIYFTDTQNVKHLKRYRIGKEHNREDHRFTSNLHGLMMTIVENITWNIYDWNVIIGE